MGVANGNVENMYLVTTNATKSIFFIKKTEKFIHGVFMGRGLADYELHVFVHAAACCCCCSINEAVMSRCLAEYELCLSVHAAAVVLST